MFAHASVGSRFFKLKAPLGDRFLDISQTRSHAGYLPALNSAIAALRLTAEPLSAGDCGN
jgi:hypothetical protein